MDPMNKWFVLIMISGLVFSILGCGSAKKETKEESLLTKADNPFVEEFNQQLGEIKDQDSAEKAVTTFIDYVDTRIDKTASGVSAQSLKALVASDLIHEIAQDELLARNGDPIRIYSEDGEEESVKPLIDVGSIRDTLMSLAESSDEAGPTVNTADDTGQIWIDDETVETVKAMVEESLPNLNSEKKQEMTPLGAIVVGYALASADNGTAAENSVKLSTEKVGSYVETISQ